MTCKIDGRNTRIKAKKGRLTKLGGDVHSVRMFHLPRLLEVKICCVAGWQQKEEGITLEDQDWGFQIEGTPEKLCLDLIDSSQCLDCGGTVVYGGA